MRCDVRDDHDRRPSANRRFDFERAVVDVVDGSQPGRRLEHEHEHHELARRQRHQLQRGSQQRQFERERERDDAVQHERRHERDAAVAAVVRRARHQPVQHPVVGKRQLLRHADDQDEPRDPGAGPHDHAVRYLHGIGERRRVVPGVRRDGRHDAGRPGLRAASRCA